MFTGIVTDVGRLSRIDGTDQCRLFIETKYDTKDIVIGASIACSGTCLTVIETGDDWFSVLASAATMACTTLGDWRVGSLLNLERSLTLGDELAGHLVTGHVDGVLRAIDIFPDADSLRMRFDLPDWLECYVASKYSIAIDGVSLTVNEVKDEYFEINVIPHTQDVTTLGDLRSGTRVNVEIDMFARYVERSLRLRGLKNG